MRRPVGFAAVLTDTQTDPGSLSEAGRQLYGESASCDLLAMIGLSRQADDLPVHPHKSSQIPAAPRDP